jgi:hypothetical protein
MADYDRDCDYDTRPEAGRIKAALGLGRIELYDNKILPCLDYRRPSSSDNERPSDPKVCFYARTSVR